MVKIASSKSFFTDNKALQLFSIIFFAKYNPNHVPFFSCLVEK